MFQEVLRNPEICAELVERLLHIQVNHIEYPELEKTIAPYYTTKGVRLDVYLKDTDKIIDVEMQSYPQDALGKRDPFKDEQKKYYGLPCYTFKNTCSENPAVNLNDKSLKVIYNASAYSEEKDDKVRAFLHFTHTNEPGEDDFTNQLSSLVEQIKDNEKFRRDYAAMNLHDRDITRAAKREGLRQGLAQGAQQKAVEAAVIAVKDFNITPQIAAEKMNAPLDKVLEGLANTHL